MVIAGRRGPGGLIGLLTSSSTLKIAVHDIRQRGFAHAYPATPRPLHPVTHHPQLRRVQLFPYRHLLSSAAHAIQPMK